MKSSTQSWCATRAHARTARGCCPVPLWHLCLGTGSEVQTSHCPIQHETPLSTWAMASIFSGNVEDARLPNERARGLVRSIVALDADIAALACELGFRKDSAVPYGDVATAMDSSWSSDEESVEEEVLEHATESAAAEVFVFPQREGAKEVEEEQQGTRSVAEATKDSTPRAGVADFREEEVFGARTDFGGEQAGEPVG